MSWQLSTFLLLALVVAIGFGWYERRRPPARVVALVAAMAALAVVGRLAFAAIPNVKPTTDIVLFAGHALGAAPGFAVGAVTALVSNVFLSQGPWTVWQMAGWGGVGVGGALLARLMRGRELGRLRLAAVCGSAGLAFGAWMDVYQWTLGARQDLDSYLAVSATSLPYNVAHAVGNVVFCLLIGPAFVRALRRFRRRFEVRWEPAPGRAPATAAVVLTALAMPAVLSVAAPPEAEAASSSARAARYLERAQNRDGGFGPARGRRSTGLHTGWAALGLAAARRNPRDVHRRRGRSIATYVRRRSRSLTDVGEIERTILVLKAAGLSPRRFGGRNLVAELVRRRRSDGSIAGYVSYTAFGILALRAAGRQAGAASASWLERAQNGDGGFGVAPNVASDTDMTGAVLQALAAAGRRGGSATRRAVGYLRRRQNGDGGFGTGEGRPSNSQSTAYAVQGLLAARAAGDVVDRALRHLKRMQRRDGSIRYSSSSSQTPVWVTAQALAALRRKPFPLRTVPRKRSRRRSRGARTAAGGTRSGGRRRSARRGARAGGGGSGAGSDTGAAARELARIGDRRVAAHSAAAPADAREGPPAWLFAVAGAGALGAAFGGRWVIRRRLRPGRT